MRRTRLVAFLILAALGAFSLAGMSGAYFTDTVTSGGNTFSAGYWIEDPSICCITPCTGSSWWLLPLRVVVWGEGFAPGAKVELVRGDTQTIAGTCVLVGWFGRSISFNLNLKGAAAGYWDVRVTNPDGGSATLKDGFYVFGFLKGHEEPDACEVYVHDNETLDVITPPPEEGSSGGGAISPDMHSPGALEQPGEKTPGNMPGGEGDGIGPGPDASRPDDGGEHAGETEDSADPPAQEESADLGFQPRSGRVGEFVEYVITGYTFVPNIVVVMRMGDGLLLSPSGEIRDKGFGGRLYLGGVQPGTWEISLKLPDGTLIPISGGFTVYE